MKKILFWSYMPPFCTDSAEVILAKDKIGSNTGNMVFQSSVARAVMVDDSIEFDAIFCGPSADLDAVAQRANAECSCFVIPLANAFRLSYTDKLEILTKLLTKLKIPSIVIGVGVQTHQSSKLESGFTFDDQAKAFVSAVLDHSSMLGLRGEMTAQYLKHLGFSEERHFTVIGCPSMYFHGGNLPEPKKNALTAQSPVCVNSKAYADPRIHSLIARGCQELPNYWYIPQTIDELAMMYAGERMQRKNAQDYMPTNRKSPVLKAGRSVGFLNAASWFDFMKDKDFAYGCNIHGNVAAVQAGVPALVLAPDLRVAEIAQYHELASLDMSEISKTKSIVDVYERTDFSRVTKNHEKRFRHFVDFLDENGIENIYSGYKSPEIAPYDRRIAQIEQAPPVYPRLNLTKAQREECRPIHERVQRARKRRLKTKVRFVMNTLKGKGK